jgi:hypothetical protein
VRPTLRAIRRRLVSALGAVLVLGACAGPQIFHHQLPVLDKGLAPAQAVARLQLPPLSEHRAAVNGRSFEFQRYRLNNGLQSDTYFLAYERGGLTFWGYITEFRRQPDRDLNAALNLVLADPAALR